MVDIMSPSNVNSGSKTASGKQTLGSNTQPINRPSSSISLSRRGQTPNTLSGFQNPTSSEREVRVLLTDYFDSTGDTEFGYQQWLFDPRWSPFFESTVGEDSGSSRVRKFSIFALPRFELDSAVSSSIVAFSLPVLQGSIPIATRQQTTMLTPTSSPSWVQVGHWDANEVFGNSVVEPNINDHNAMACGTVAVLNPDDLSLSTSKVQYRVELEVGVTLPLVTKALYSVPSANVPLWNDSLSIDADLEGQVILGSYLNVGNST